MQCYDIELVETTDGHQGVLSLDHAVSRANYAFALVCLELPAELVGFVNHYVLLVLRVFGARDHVRVLAVHPFAMAAFPFVAGVFLG